MKKIYIRLLLPVLCFLLCCCAGTSGNCRDINYQKYPLNMRGLLTYDENEYTVDISVEKSGDIEITVLLPERLKGAVFSLRDGICSFDFAGVGSRIDDGGYSAAQGIYLSAAMFSLSADQFSGSEIVTDNGVRYSSAEYRINTDLVAGSVRIFTQRGLDFPDMIKAELNGHVLSFVFSDRDQNIN